MCAGAAGARPDGMTDYRYTMLASPIGELIIVAADDKVAAIHFAGQGAGAVQARDADAR